MSGGFNPLSIATSALGLLGGGPLGMLVSQVFQQVVSQVVDQVIEQLPIPQAAKDILQGGFAAATGNVQGFQQNIDELLQGLAENPLDMLGMGNAVQDFQDTLQDIMNQGVQQAAEANESEGGGEGSWIRALVAALGPKLNELAGEMETLAGEAKDSPEKAMEFQAASQEFNLLMNSLTTAIKSIGEGLTTAARKQ
ncbi:MAG: hypothetical protein WA979_08865 [Pacificimonas sp.]